MITVLQWCVIVTVMVLFAWSMWTDKTYLYITKKCNNYAENNTHHYTKFSCPSNQGPGICAPLVKLLSNIMDLNDRDRTDEWEIKILKKRDKYTEVQNYICRGYTINSEGISQEIACNYKPRGWRVEGGSKNVDRSIFRQVYWAQHGSQSPLAVATLIINMASATTTVFWLKLNNSREGKWSCEEVCLQWLT